MRPAAVPAALALWIPIALTACRTPPRPRLESSPVRITEIHFHPAHDQGNAEFIEISNLSRQPADLSGWEVTGAGELLFPAGTAIPGGRSIVLCGDPAVIRMLFGTSVPIAATFPGKLKNEGEEILLIDADGRVADEASYKSKPPWTVEASGTGNSLHRVEPIGDGSSPESWRAGKPSPGSR